MGEVRIDSSVDWLAFEEPAKIRKIEMSLVRYSRIPRTGATAIGSATANRPHRSGKEGAAVRYFGSG